MWVLPSQNLAVCYTAPEAEMQWEVINSEENTKKNTKYTFQSMKKHGLILQSWLIFLFNVPF